MKTRIENTPLTRQVRSRVMYVPSDGRKRHNPFNLPRISRKTVSKRKRYINPCEVYSITNAVVKLIVVKCENTVVVKREDRSVIISRLFDFVLLIVFYIVALPTVF